MSHLCMTLLKRANQFPALICKGLEVKCNIELAQLMVGKHGNVISKQL